MRRKQLFWGATFALLCCCLMAAKAQIVPQRRAAFGLAGRWKIAYHPNNATRTYDIDRSGKVYFTETSARSRVERTDQGLLLRFNAEPDKLERLTLGADGRLFIEHFNPRSNFPQKLDQVGIGVRQ